MNLQEITLDNLALADELKGTVADNARKLGISRQHLNNILKGHKKPSADLLLKIQSLFEVSAESISKNN